MYKSSLEDKNQLYAEETKIIKARLTRVTWPNRSMSGNDGKVMTIINGLAKSHANYGHHRFKGNCNCSGSNGEWKLPKCINYTPR